MKKKNIIGIYETEEAIYVNKEEEKEGKIEDETKLNIIIVVDIGAHM